MTERARKAQKLKIYNIYSQRKFTNILFTNTETNIFSYKFQAQCLVEDGFENKIKMRDENINNKVHKTHGSAKLLLLKISPQCLHFGGSIFFGTKLKANTKMETDVEQARAGVNSMFSPFCTLLFFSQIHQEGVKRMRVQQ